MIKNISVYCCYIHYQGLLVVRRTKADALTTRSELLDAAERVFSEQGVANTSMLQVAAAAGVTRGAIYHHFDNKLDLIDSLMERVKLPVDEMFEELTSSLADDPLEQLRQRCLRIAEQVQHDEHMQALINILFLKCEYTSDVEPIHCRHLMGRNNCINESEKLLQQAINNGQVRPECDPRMTVIGLFSLLDGLLYNWLLQRDFFDLESAVTAAIDHYLRGIRLP